MMEQKKHKLFVLIGVPGSGKSYWINNHKDSFPGTLAVISRDTIRFVLVGENESYFSKEKQVFTTFVNHIKVGLNYYDNTIADATHISPSSRGKLLRALGDSLKDVEVNAIVIDTCLAKCLEQNAGREGRKLVPESAIRNMFSNFSMPTLEEGFDNIYIYRQNGNKIIYEILKKDKNNE